MIIIFGDPVSAEFKGALEGSTASDNQTTRPFFVTCFVVFFSLFPLGDPSSSLSGNESWVLAFPYPAHLLPVLSLFT